MSGYSLCRVGGRGFVPDCWREFQSYKANKHATRYVSSVTSEYVTSVTFVHQNWLCIGAVFSLTLYIIS